MSTNYAGVSFSLPFRWVGARPTQRSPWRYIPRWNRIGVHPTLLLGSPLPLQGIPNNQVFGKTQNKMEAHSPSKESHMKVLLIGDFILDQYTYGTATRLCPEAPVPVVIPQAEFSTPGGMGLVEAQLTELGVDVTAVPWSYSKKHRIFASKHLVVRIDEDSIPSPVERNQLDISVLSEGCDLIIVSDYGKGKPSEKEIKDILGAGKTVFVDAKKDWEQYKGKNVWLFPNAHEALDAKVQDFAGIVRKLGSQGCRLDTTDFVISQAATVDDNDVADVTGAGDIFLAGFAYSWLRESEVPGSLLFASQLAGESCRHTGTHVVPKTFLKAKSDTDQSFLGWL